MAIQRDARHSPSVDPEGGFALLVVLILLLLMIVLVGDLVFSAQMDLRRARLESAVAQADAAAEGALERTKLLLALDGRQSGPDGLHDVWNAPSERHYRLGEAQITVEVVDENRKFNVYQLEGGTAADHRAAVDRFVRVLVASREDTSFPVGYGEGMTHRSGRRGLSPQACDAVRRRPTDPSATDPETPTGRALGAGSRSDPHRDLLSPGARGRDPAGPGALPDRVGERPGEPQHCRGEGASGLLPDHGTGLESTHPECAGEAPPPAGGPGRQGGILGISLRRRLGTRAPPARRSLGRAPPLLLGRERPLLDPGTGGGCLGPANPPNPGASSPERPPAPVPRDSGRLRRPEFLPIGLSARGLHPFVRNREVLSGFLVAISRSPTNAPAGGVARGSRLGGPGLPAWRSGRRRGSSDQGHLPHLRGRSQHG